MEATDNDQSNLVSEEKKHWLRIGFGEEAYVELGNLQNKISAESKTALIRAAIGMLIWAADEIHGGNRILVQKKDGKVKEMNFKFIPRPSS